MLRPSRTARLHVDETKETEDNNKKKGAAVAINRKTDERERMREKGINETNKKETNQKGGNQTRKENKKKTNKKKGGKRKVRTGTAAGNHIDSIRQLFGRSTVFHRHFLFFFFFFFFFFFRRFCSFFIGRFFFIGRDTRPSLYRVFHRRWNLVATRRHRSRRRRR